ncbi:MAG: HAD-IB family hydrolase [Methyloprofundus sp.]|nr:HAD-IB family hydrolase [Methyloprofundus sp.]
MSLAIFDLDNTLLADDSDYLWGQFLVDKGIVDAAFYEQENERFYQEYKQGKLDIHEFLNFSLKPLADNSPQDLYRWREQFIDEVIQPILLQPAQELVNKHKQQGDTLLVITATNKFVTEPIVNLYGISHLLATMPEMINHKYSGKVAGTPCFQEGKVTRLNQWLKETGHTLENSWFYSDSHNDLPLLQLVEHPVAVNPDEKLKQYADKASWPVISLREQECPTHHLKK